MNIDILLYIAAFICFLLAAFGVPRVQWPWLAFACLTLTLIV